ncbi:MAG: glycosyltransferase family 4 protein [Elusimicrobiota bacterium]|nr:glycosyltransferase family 4 protein [Elusimicrobiota bacterium]
MKLKVCHIITLLELGGAQQNTLYTVGNLDRDTFQTVLICGSGGILDKEAQELTDTNVYFVRWLIRQINPLYDFMAFLKILQILHFEKPDIVHTHSSKAGILGRWAAVFAGIPVIIHTFHGFGFHDWQNFFVKNFFILLERITSSITTKLIAVSEENIKTALRNKIGDEKNYVLIRSGIKISDYKNAKIDINQKKYEFGLSTNSRIITTIGPFKPQKNLIDFIKMAKILSYDLQLRRGTCKGGSHEVGRYDLRFLIVGDGEQRKSLEFRVESLGLKDRVLFIGWRRDIPEILSITDIFVMTSLWEGLPRAVVEALVSGKPVVAYAVDGIKEIVKDAQTGFLVKPKDVKTLSEKVLLLLQDEKYYLCACESARKSVDETFDIDFMVRQQEKLYSALSPPKNMV